MRNFETSSSNSKQGTRPKMYLHTFGFFVVLSLLTVAPVSYAAPSRFLNAVEKAEILKHLNRVNKPPVKSIKSPDGDIIDCVHILQQPTFDHPFFKNHTIKMRPNYQPDWLKDDNIKVSSTNASNVGPLLSSSPAIPQLWHVNGKCPKETIPVRRTKIEDILRAGSVESYVTKKTGFPVIAADGGNHEYAIVRTSGLFYGAKATLNVWNPRVEEFDEFSLGQLWITAGPDSDLNSIEAGWHVYPYHYQSTDTRLFIYWTSNGYHGTGCHNLECPGFVQTNNDVALGGSISDTSQVDGTQIEIVINVWKDRTDGNWWLHVGDTVVGYWPAGWFSYLDTASSEVSWGGEVINDRANGYHTATQMGSGRLSTLAHGLGEVSYFKNIQICDDYATFRDPESLFTITTDINCYDLDHGKDNDWGSFFYYGGPGRNAQCQ